MGVFLLLGGHLFLKLFIQGFLFFCTKFYVILIVLNFIFCSIELETLN